jgi:hypothetical protein
MDELNLGPNGGLIYCMEYPSNLFNTFFIGLFIYLTNGVTI